MKCGPWSETSRGASSHPSQQNTHGVPLSHGLLVRREDRTGSLDSHSSSGDSKEAGEHTHFDKGAPSEHITPAQSPGRLSSTSVGREMQPSTAAGHYQHGLHGMLPPEHQQTSYGEPPHSSAADTAFPGLRPHQYLVAGNHSPNGDHITAPPQQAHKSHPGSKPTPTTKLYTEDANGEEIVYNGSAEHLERHNRGEKIERVYDCTDCDKAFTREEHLKRHAKIHTDEPVHRCEVVGCSKAYTRKERLTRHYKVAHLGQEPERPFWCSQCGKDFQRKEHLTRHERNIHGPGGSQDASNGGERDGVATAHASRPRPPHHYAPRPKQHAPRAPRQPRIQNLDDSGSGSGGTLHCTYEGCPKTYSRREHLNRHIKLHMGIEPDRPYYCLDCGKTFTRKEHLLRHRRSHTGETPYPCPGLDCSKQFARKEHLKRHMRVHTGEHPYPCSECGRSFGRRERLLKHLKTHGMHVAEPVPRPRNQQPKNEPVQFKKEPEFIQDPPPSHGVFGSQTTELLRMITQKGPLSPDQLGMAQAQAYASQEHLHPNPEVRAALSNPEIVKAFSNPDVVKAFASPPKRTIIAAAAAPQTAAATAATQDAQPAVTTAAQQAATAAVTRGPDIANSPAVPPELSKLPPTFSIFPVVQGGPAVVQATDQVQTSNGYYHSAPSYVATTVAPHRPGELTTLPMSWPTSWHMSTMQPAGAMVNIRSPAKLEPSEAKQWEPAATAYFRAPFS